MSQMRRQGEGNPDLGLVRRQHGAAEWQRETNAGRNFIGRSARRAAPLYGKNTDRTSTPRLAKRVAWPHCSGMGLTFTHRLAGKVACVHIADANLETASTNTCKD